MSELHALLIGVDDYLPDRLPDGARYPSLHGAVEDAGRMAFVLRDRFGLQPERTRMLLSRKGEDGHPLEPPERRPTYTNLVAAFKALAVDARPGDRVYIHYSGHGARLPTEYPEVKGENAHDEALVPCDIGEPGSRYLRDLELATLVQLLVDRGLLVTLVLDCCHAGGAMRGRSGEIWKARPRRVSRVRPTPVPSAVGEPAVLAKVWQSLSKGPSPLRGLELQSRLPVVGYALFAACRPDELAFEYPFEKGEPQGALTYWLLDTLKRSDRELSCGEIHQRLVARVRGYLMAQTPVFLGPGERGFLAEAVRAVERAPLGTPGVVRLDEDGRVLIESFGRSTGARPGARLLLPQAELEIHQVGATESWAEVVRVLGPEPIEPGTRAEVLPLCAAIRLVPPEPGDRAAEQALDGLRKALREQSGFLDLCTEEGTPDLCVTIGEGRVYEIRDPGGVLFPNLCLLPADAPEASLEVIRRLDHLAKFRNILTVENPNAPEWLGIGLELGEGGAASRPSARSLALRVDESLSLRLVNRSSLRLDFTVLNLAPDYSVTQLLPSPGSFSLLPLDPGESFPLSLRGWLPAGYNEGNDILKIFATLGAVSFGWLKLQALDDKRPPSYDREIPKTPLDLLFARLAALRPTRHGLRPSEFPDEEWITAQVEIRVRR